MSGSNDSRRRFLLDALKATGAFAAGETLTELVLANVFNQALAQVHPSAQAAGQAVGVLNPSSSTNERFYIHVSLPGGPPRWLFDLPLTPNGASDLFSAGHFGTKVVKDGASAGVAYDTIKYTEGSRSIYLPPVWNMPLPQVDFKLLLPHMLMVRGMDMEINNHPVSNGRQVAPILNSTSLSGALVDQSSMPIPSIIDRSSPAATVFKGKSGLSSVAINYAENAGVNPVSTLLQPFSAFKVDRLHTKDSRTLAKQALDQFDRYAEKNRFSRSALSRAYQHSLDLISGNVVSLSVEWPMAVAKYRQIVEQALRPEAGSLPGINNVSLSSIGLSGDARLLYSVADSAKGPLCVEKADVLTMITRNSTIARLAENFAVAEILIGRTTSTMTISAPGIEGLELDAAGTTASGNHDQHFMGPVVSTIVTTLFYRALLGCLTELVKSLKSRGIFDKTVIHVASEWNRNPRVGGSDHGVDGSNTSLISGLIQQLQVIGNIRKDSTIAGSPGTWGQSLPYSLDETSRPIQVNDVARTVTSMLGIDDIVTNGRSLMIPSSQGWVPRKPEARNG